MRLPFYQVDAFTARRFAGNPAAVCVVPEEITLGSELMQKIAAENNLSETAFVQMVCSEDISLFQSLISKSKMSEGRRRVASGIVLCRTSSCLAQCLSYCWLGGCTRSFVFVLF
mmetsp:Transcript_11375/g.26993  ORF Transcript_11375/g.26993 Transcript_11375/m.26993 type:complete len:114 (+) Transcript_11375:149-490(+)